MLNVLFFSIAGKKSNNVIDDILSSLVEESTIPPHEIKILKHTIEVAKNGNYPSVDYYKNLYKVPDFTYNSLAEITKYSKDCIDFYRSQALQKSLIKAINDSTGFLDLQSKISELLNSVEVEKSDDLLEGYKPYSFVDSLAKPKVKGVSSGVSEIDQITNGFQPGTIAAVCAFTGHGKSTFMVSSVFKNIREDKKCVFLSLEMAPDLIWQQFEARYLYEVKGLQVSSSDLINKKLDSETEEMIKEYDQDFRKDICENLIILDESFISKKVMLDYKKFSKLMHAVEKRLGGLDLLVIDHIGQFELMYEECGNAIIKQLQSFTKTYVNNKGVNPTTMFAVQTNREGEKRARRREGIYDIQAISDLNEVERSASYIVFMYTSDDMKVVQETKCTLSKNRLGPVLTEPVVVSFNPSVCVVGTTVESISMSEDDFNDMGIFNFDDEF